MIRPIPITDAMLLYSSVAEPDSGETAWSATEINAAGDERYLGAPTSTVTITQASPAVITWAAHGLAIGVLVSFTNSGGALPSGLVSGQTYYVRTVPDANTFTVSATPNGRRIATSTAGSGTQTCKAWVHTIFEALQGQRSTVTMTIASPGVVTYANHGFAVDTPIVFTTTGALPTGLSAGTTYYVRSPTVSTFQVSATAGGASINTTGSQSGTHTCGLAANYNVPPLTNTLVWSPSRSTNKYGMFDQSLTASTTADSLLRVQLKPGAFDSFYADGVDADYAQADLTINNGTPTITIASPGVVTMAAHGFIAGTQVVFFTTGALPTGIVAGTIYYVIAAGLTTNTFEISATLGGAAINTSGSQSGTHFCGQSVYQYSKNMSNGTTVGDWLAYFYTPILMSDFATANQFVDAGMLSLPAYASGVFTFTLTRSGGQVGIAELIVGTAFVIGITTEKPSLDINDLSVKTYDALGNETVVQRVFQKRMTCQVQVDNDDVDNVNQILAAYRAVNAVYLGSANPAGSDPVVNSYESMNIYGKWQTFSNVPETGLAFLNIQVLGQPEGLT